MSNLVLLLILFNLIIMSKKSVFSQPIADESHSRNAFDRSFELNINFSSGMMIPTFAKFCFGHSHVRINQRSFFRTADVNTAAFPSLPMYTDYFFVPMHQLISSWNAFRSRTNDRFSTRLGNIARLPTFSKTNVASALGSITGSMAGDIQVNDAVRLLDALDYGWNFGQLQNNNFDNYDSGVALGFHAVGDVTPLMLCAYQKIYYDHFRNTAYEANDVEAYNLDDLYILQSTGNEVVQSISDARLLKFLKLHYVNYRRDFLQTIYPSLNFVSSAANGLQANNSLPASIVNTIIHPVSGETQAPLGLFDSNAVNVNRPISNTSDGSIFSLQNLRVAFALEKLLRVSAFTPQHVKDQFRARFGYTPKSDSLNESVRLGSFKNDIIVGEVTQTATTSSGGVTHHLGTVGGKGVGAGNYEKPISYDVPEDGIIMGISYVLPRNTYDSDKVDMIHQQFVAEDWSLPEYENLGLQPIYAKNMFLLRLQTDQDSTQLARANAIMGYQPRDMQYKASISTNHGLFIKSQLLSPWVLHGSISNLSYIARGNGIDYSYFKVQPSDINEIFVDAYDGTPLTDQFFGNIVCQFGCIQDKPIFGIPKI